MESLLDNVSVKPFSLNPIILLLHKSCIFAAMSTGK